MIDDDLDEEYYDPPNETPLMTTEEVTALMGVSRQTIYNWRKKGLLTAYRVGIGRNVAFSRADIQALLDQTKVIERI